ncbi:MAG: class II D-tagatose-bisphosphate aldolase, non-catalytic subunit [Oscillospiraceae bacterium]|nr:class II D-tagatose-bisphosphate aldolase, non-catalytic subunit [Oscillospiraceae bacterium]
MNSVDFFKKMLQARAEGKAAGIYSVCSANSYVLQAAMEQSMEDGAPVLIEATANQVNQLGGYTGMTPADFSSFVYRIAKDCGFPKERIILGGDHLGPIIWKDKPEQEAMPFAEKMVSDFVSAGFSKIHLDTSMRLADDSTDVALSAETIARRGAVLCAAAEKAWRDTPGIQPPVYIIGSEVPTPGGPQEEIETLTPTSTEDFLRSYQTFKDSFEAADLSLAFSRVVAFVVQPGVEFTGSEVFEYNRAAAANLSIALRGLDPPLVFEGHSTDYQNPYSLKSMVEDGIAILKVGPALTFALREGLMALEFIEKELAAGGTAGFTPSNFLSTLEEAMLSDSSNWKNHYKGEGNDLRLQFRYSFFDRARYYLALPEVSGAVEKLLDNLEKTGVPLTILSQYMPQSFERVRAGVLSSGARDLLKDYIRRYMRVYSNATCF